ncbi:hypothetical protein [Arthrobacter roseus]|uniref:hypothetical protein n=1 Tax=Arthrobacter roseus TaxID=136274 RepID=UPI0019639265|nr:hypothetical protein [Arthrobacter roseus]MBM7846847.1 hypothetical protein [Arthrobacter roseus]
MAERGSTTNGPALDDELKHESQGLIQGNHPTRAEDWREAETVEDDLENTPDPVSEGIGSVTDTSDKKDVEASDITSQGGPTP